MLVPDMYSSGGNYIVVNSLDVLYLLSSFFFVLNIAELDALEADMEFESAAVPSYLQPDEESDLNLPAAPTYPAAVPVSRHQVSGFHVHLHCTTECNSHIIFNLA